MIAALLLAATAPQTAIEAERAFAAMAQTEGQWTAFRATAEPEAIMFFPQPTKIQDWLRGRADPQHAYMWWPAEAWTSCDGRVAVTTGPSIHRGKPGYFTTVWRKQADGGWKWILDHGNTLDRARPAGETAISRRASCNAIPRALPDQPPHAYEVRSSPDRSLVWRWHVYESGNRIIWVELWDGRAYRKVIEDKV